MLLRLLTVVVFSPDDAHRTASHPSLTIYEHQRDPESVRMVGFVSREREAFMEHWAKIAADPQVIARAVDEDGVFAGHVTSFPRDDKQEIGYWFGREFWGRGIATEALSRFLRLETRRPLWAGVIPTNTGSQRVLRKCGFVAAPRTEVSSAPGASAEDILFLLD
jgi:RimJ/RimL family protein N-acetyltransferase